jgi:hypothetical protein
VWFDGSQHVVGAGDSVGTYNTYKPIFAAHYLDPSQMLVSVTLDLNAVTLTGTSTVNAQVAPGETINLPANCKIRCALYEDHVPLGGGRTEPHTGNTEMNYIARLMISETTLTATNSGDTQQVVTNFPIDPSWKIQDLHAVAFVQRDTNKKVLQAGFSPAQYQVLVSDLGAPVQRINSGAKDFNSQVLYQGTVNDDVRMSIDKTGLPVGWDAQIVWNGNSYDTEVTIPNMTKDQQEAVSVRVTPSGPGMGTVGFSVEPVSLPPGKQDHSYITFYQRPKLLFVDDDNGAHLETYYQNALASAGYFALGHNVAALNGATPPPSWMANFDAVIWNTDSLQVLTLGGPQQADLMTYLDGGGKLFLCSQGFLNDRGLVTLTTNYLRVSAFTRDVGAPTVTGVAGDPIGDGMSFAVTPPFTNLADALTPGVGGAAWLDSGANHVAVRYDSGVFKTVFLTAPFEGIAAPNDGLVMQRVLQWLVPDTATDAPVIGAQVAGGLALYQNVPNPFGGTTSLRFSLPSAGHVGLAIYDVAGRRVASLVDRRLEAGTHSVDWDGRDASGARVASGVYLIRLKAGSQTVSREMVRVQ